MTAKFGQLWPPSVSVVAVDGRRAGRQGKDLHSESLVPQDPRTGEPAGIKSPFLTTVFCRGQHGRRR